MTFAKKSLGQNFLVDANYQRKIISAAQSVYQGETVIEIGPGRGALTQHLQGFASRLILVEKDRDLANELKEQWTDPKIEIINQDVLKWDLTALKDDDNIVVANLPYNVSTQILIGLLQNMRKFKFLFLMFQKEVAMRCIAKPDTKDFGVLSAWVQVFTHAEKICDVPPTAFRPRPKITSTVLKFAPNGTLYDQNQQKLISFIKLIFSQRRRKISSVLKGQYVLEKALSNPQTAPWLDLRAEALGLEKMRTLFEVLR